MQRRQNLHLTLAQVKHQLRHNPNLKDLEIQPFTTEPMLNNAVDGLFSSTTGEELIELSHALETNTSLRCIRINYSTADHIEWTDHLGAKAIGDSLKKHPNLRFVIINLPRNDVKEETLIGFLQCLTGSAKINFLILQIWSDTPTFLNALGEILQNKSCLREISIHSSYKSKSSSTEIISLSSFAKGLGAQKSLQSLNLAFLRLGDNGITEIAASMKNVTSLNSLEFRSCSIKDEAKQVCSIALNNPALKVFSLSFNELKETGIQEIARILPTLKNLTDLDLSNTNLNKAAFTFLVFSIARHHLSIKRLNLGYQNFKIIDPSLKLLAELIKDNPHLEKLYLKYISPKKLTKLAPLLSDQNCKLRKFYFLHPSTLLTSESKKILLSILYKNENLHDIGPFIKSREIHIACDRNLRKKYLRKWNLFIDVALCLLNINYFTTTGSIKKCPFAISLWLSFLVPKKPIETSQYYQLYVDLIKQNLQNRLSKEYNPEKTLQKYDPEKPLQKYAILNRNRETIKSIWWKTSIEEKKSPLPLVPFSEEKCSQNTLFVPKEKIQPSQLTLADMIQIISPYLYSESTKEILPESPGENNIILFDISHLKAGDQRYINDVFSRLTKFFYFNPKPTVEIFAGKGKLQITKVSLQDMIDDIAILPDPVTAPATHSCCSTM